MRVRFLVEGDASNGSVTVFECDVPAQSRMPAPHSHDAFEETIYGLEGVTAWTVDGEVVELGPGNAICITRGLVHEFSNPGSSDARFLAVATPGVFGAAYFREIAEVLAVEGPPDRAAGPAVMGRHGLTPAAPSPA